MAVRATLQMMLNGLSAQAALLAHDGTILVANDAWTKLAERLGYGQLKVEGNYIAFNCDRAAEGNADSFEILRGLAEVSAGSLDRFEHSFRGQGLTDGMEFRILLTSIAFGGQPYIFINRYDVTELNKLRRQRRSLGIRLLRAQDVERRRVARDLHDSTSQLLVGLQLRFSQLKQTSPTESCEPLLAECEQALAAIQREIRTLSFVCHPPSLGTCDLARALENMARGFGDRAGLTTDVSFNNVGTLAPAIEGTLYRVAQEALANVYRHARASSIRLRLEGTRRCVHLIIEDDGIGFKAATDPGVPQGLGITGITARVAELGGRLSIRSLVQGTAVIASLPRVERSLET